MPQPVLEAKDVNGISFDKKMKKIAIIANYNPNAETHVATSSSLDLLIGDDSLELTYEWIDCEKITLASFSDYSGFFIGTGGPTPCLKDTLAVIEYARKFKVPLLGTCGGFQNVILETAINVVGIKDAVHEEAVPESNNLFIIKLSCSLRGRKMTLRFKDKSMVRDLYGVAEAQESYYCSYGVNPEVIEDLEAGGLRIVGSDDEGIVRVVERVGHPFFLATLFVPQVKSVSGNPHPIIRGFVEAVSNNG